MGAPYLATGRIRFSYSVPSLTHVAHAFVKGLNYYGGAWFIEGRTGPGLQIPWEDAAQGMANVFNAIMPSTATYGVAQLEQRVGLQWFIRDVHTPTATPTGSPSQSGSQVTLTLRTAGFYKLKVVLLDTTRYVNEARLTTPTGGDANMDTFIDHYITVTTDTKRPVEWQVSQDEQFIIEGGFVSCAFDYNADVGHRRGLK